MKGYVLSRPQLHERRELHEDVPTFSHKQPYPYTTRPFLAEGIPGLYPSWEVSYALSVSGFDGSRLMSGMQGWGSKEKQTSKLQTSKLASETCICGARGQACNRPADVEQYLHEEGE
jgi:hypothetical protein